MGRRLVVLAVSSLSACRGAAAAPEGTEGTAPRAVKLQGELVCLLEEVSKRHGVQIAPVHDHLLGVRTAQGDLYTLLRTSTSEFLFTDLRFRGRALVLTGRTFGSSGLLEATRIDWVKEGKVHEVYYWCEVCSIKGVNPGPCACCQGPVELRERPEGGGKETTVPDLEKEGPKR